MKELELYLHIPFCVKKCNYCDFLSAPAGEKTRAAYVDALLEEIRGFDEPEDYEVVTEEIMNRIRAVRDHRAEMEAAE